MLLSTTIYCSPGPGCVNSTLCYDGDSDPKGLKYDGCVNTTVSGKTCQVKIISIEFTLLPRFIAIMFTLLV